MQLKNRGVRKTCDAVVGFDVARSKRMEEAHVGAEKLQEVLC